MPLFSTMIFVNFNILQKCIWYFQVENKSNKKLKKIYTNKNEGGEGLHGHGL